LKKLHLFLMTAREEKVGEEAEEYKTYLPRQCQKR